MEARANNVALAPLQYALALPLQAAALSEASWAHLLFFCGFATLTVNLAATAKPIRNLSEQELTMQQAVLAPIAASALLLGLYALIVYYDFDPSKIYRLSVCSLALWAVRDLAVQAVAAAARTAGLTTAPLPPEASVLTGSEEEEEEEAPPLFTQAERGVALALSLALVGDYAWSAGTSAGGGLTAWQLIEQNLLAWSLAMFSIGVVSLRTFTTAAVFLSGLFCYDIFWVFSTDVMMTVAMKVDAPVKLLAINPTASAYPYAALGLGDIAIPAFFCSLMHQYDLALASDATSPDAPPPPYRRNAVLAYALGLCATFWANENLQRGQPALLYLVPAVIGSALLTARRRGEVPQLLAFEAPVTSDRIPLDLAMLSEEQRNPVR